MKNIFSKIGAILGIEVLLTLPFFVVAKGNDKITIYHATGSKTNPFVEITISVNGLKGHMNHINDIIPASEEGCVPYEPPASE